MKAVVLNEQRDVKVQDIDQPVCEPGHVLLKVGYCGICGTDLHAPVLDIFHPPVVMGHEFSGEVVEVGEGVEGFKDGDRVSVNPNGVVCRECYWCKSGQAQFCQGIWQTAIGIVEPGGMEPYVPVKPETLHRLPDGVSLQHGAWVEPLAVSVRTVRRSEIKLGEEALVFGAGPIGLLAIQALRAAGAGRITAIEPSSFRGELAGRMGADEVIDPLKEDLKSHFPDSSKAPAHALECSGHPSAVDAALEILRPRGRLTVVGISPEPPNFKSENLLFKEIDIRGSFIYEEEFDMAIDLLNRGVIDVEALTTDVRPVERAEESFAEMREPDKSIKIILKPN